MDETPAARAAIPAGNRGSLALSAACAESDPCPVQHKGPPEEQGAISGALSTQGLESNNDPPSAVGRGLVALIRLYQKTAPFRPRTCRFYPTCSSYAIQAIERHGAARGIWKAAKRLCRCHPLNPGGYDPVR